MLWIAEAVQAWVRQALRRRAASVEGSELPETSVPELLSLGGDQSGDAYVLNLSTGAIDRVPPVPPVRDPDSAPVHPLSQVTPALLALICDRAGYHTRVDALGGVTVFTGIGEVLLTTLGEQADLIMLSRLYPFAETTPARDRVKLVRRLNRRSLVVRFDSDNGLWFLAQCPLLITSGLSPAQLLATLRVFVDQTQLHMTDCKAYRLLA
jgi:hypothetical protein